MSDERPALPEGWTWDLDEPRVTSSLVTIESGRDGLVEVAAKIEGFFGVGWVYREVPLDVLRAFVAECDRVRGSESQVVDAPAELAGNGDGQDAGDRRFDSAQTYPHE